MTRVTASAGPGPWTSSTLRRGPRVPAWSSRPSHAEVSPVSAGRRSSSRRSRGRRAPGPAVRGPGLVAPAPRGGAVPSGRVGRTGSDHRSGPRRRGGSSPGTRCDRRAGRGTPRPWRPGPAPGCAGAARDQRVRVGSGAASGTAPARSDRFGRPPRSRPAVVCSTDRWALLRPHCAATAPRDAGPGPGDRCEPGSGTGRETTPGARSGRARGPGRTAAPGGPGTGSSASWMFADATVISRRPDAHDDGSQPTASSGGTTVTGRPKCFNRCARSWWSLVEKPCGATDRKISSMGSL